MIEVETTLADTDNGYVLEDQIGYLLRRAHQRASAIFQEIMIEGLTPPQFAAAVTSRIGLPVRFASASPSARTPNHAIPGTSSSLVGTLPPQYGAGSDRDGSCAEMGLPIDPRPENSRVAGDIAAGHAMGEGTVTARFLAALARGPGTAEAGHAAHARHQAGGGCAAQELASGDGHDVPQFLLSARQLWASTRKR